MSFANRAASVHLPSGQNSFLPPAPIQQHRPVVDEQPKNLTGKVTLLSESRDGVTYISCGGSSTIWLGRWRRGQGPSDEKLAIKAFLGSQLHHQAQTFLRRIIRETMNWHKLRHPNILPFYGICHEKIERIPDFPALISPYCANGNIHDFLSTRPTTNKLRIICQVSDGLAYLHVNQVVHGDLKGSNILVDDSGVACICDFARAKLVTDNDYSKSLFESAHWAAPELLLHASEDQTVPVSYKSDMWAFAMVVIEILTGGRPWPGYSDLVVLRKVPLGEKPDRRRYPAVSDSYWRVLTPCWEFDPSRRPSIQAFKGWLPSPGSPTPLPLQSLPSTSLPPAVYTAERNVDRLGAGIDLASPGIYSNDVHSVNSMPPPPPSHPPAGYTAEKNTDRPVNDVAVVDLASPGIYFNDFLSVNSMPGQPTIKRFARIRIQHFGTIFSLQATYILSNGTVVRCTHGEPEDIPHLITDDIQFQESEILAEVHGQATSGLVWQLSFVLRDTSTHAQRTEGPFGDEVDFATWPDLTEFHVVGEVTALGGNCVDSMITGIQFISSLNSGTKTTLKRVKESK